MENSNKIKLEIHHEAARKLNEDAKTLLTTVKANSKVPYTSTSLPLMPDVPVKAIFRAEDTHDFETMMVGANGKRLARLFSHKDKEIGFEEENYKDFVRFCEAVQKGKPFRQYVSLTFIEDVVFDWVREQYCGTSSESLTEYLLPKCESNIREVEVWIPISHTYAQTNFGFADVIIIKPFSQAMFEGLRQDYKAQDLPEEYRKGILMTLDRYQAELGGVAAATMFVTAEPRRAYEIAQEQAEKAVALMRIFSKAAFIPEVSSCTALYGQKTAQSELYFIFHEKGFYTHDGGGCEEDVPFNITTEKFRYWHEAGMGAFVKLFFSTERTPFEQKVFESLMIYSRSTLMTNPSDKLMYVFSALEALLVRDANESLQQTVAERIAFLIGKNSQECKGIVTNYKATYKLRSNYVHHGMTVTEMDTLSVFYSNAFQCFFNIVHLNLSHKSKDDFLSAIEDRKFSF